MARAIWKKLTSDPSIQRSSQVLSVIGNDAYIYGGELRPREPVDSSVYRIPLDSGLTSNAQITTLSSTDPTPQPRVGTASATIGDKLYLFTGRGGVAMAPVEENGSLWVFDTKTTSWSQLSPAPGSPFPQGRSYHALTSNGTDTIYLHAGCPTTDRLSDLWAFDITSKIWKELPSAPGPARGGTSIAFSNGKIYRMNGFDGKTEQGGALDVFDVAANEWTTMTFPADGVSGPEARSVAALLAVTIAGRDSLVTLFGERDPSSLGHAGAGKMLGDVWVFDIEDHKWSQVSVTGGDGADEKPAPRGWFDADVFAIHGRPSGLVVHGGLSESNERLGDVWVLEFE
ncbi:kelch repeat protein [Aspergillus pseudodeflectus]|uniref:Kelch repeat protein n=1 Tax=Aspergillus pseudodeflectus TaxID=176178 RepID=A0ABR4L484_9EURO